MCNMLHMIEKQVLAKVLSVSLSDSEILNLLGKLKENDSELERECGISRKTIYNWKKGKVGEISRETKEKLVSFILNKYDKEGLMTIAEVKRYSYIQILLELMREGLNEEEKRKLEVIIKDDKVSGGEVVIPNSTPAYSDYSSNYNKTTNSSLLSLSLH